MDVSTVNLDIVSLSLILTGAMFFTVLIISIITVIIRGKRISLEGDEMYIGGEGEEVLMYRVPSVIALYWGIVKKAWKKAFEMLRDAVHTGILNDWYGYMGIWLGLILLLALIFIAIYMIW